MILIDKEIEVAQQIDPGYNSYKEAGKLRKELLRKLSDLREGLEKSCTTDDVRSTLIEYREFKIFLHRVYMDLPHNKFYFRMLCLCLSRILKTDIYCSNSQMSEDQIYSLISEMKMKNIDKKIEELQHPKKIYLEHPFWSLKVTPVSTERSVSSGNQIFETEQGYFLMTDTTFGTNILDNTHVDLIAATVDAKFKVEVTDKLAEKVEKIKEAEEIKEAAGKSPGHSPSVSDIRVAAKLVNTGYLTKLKYLRFQDLVLSPSEQAKQAAKKIRKTGEGWYRPSVSDLRVAAELVNTGYLAEVKCLSLEDLDLSPSDEADINSLLSVCTDHVEINNVRGCDLIIKHVKSEVLWICNQILSASETADLVTIMRDRVERLVLGWHVTLDVETVDCRLLRQGTCRELQCYGNTCDKYREYLTSWAYTMGLKTVKKTNDYRVTTASRGETRGNKRSSRKVSRTLNICIRYQCLSLEDLDLSPSDEAKHVIYVRNMEPDSVSQ